MIKTKESIEFQGSKEQCEIFEKAFKAEVGKWTTPESNPESSPSTKVWYEDLTKEKVEEVIIEVYGNDSKLVFVNEEGKVYQGKEPESAVSLLIEGLNYWTEFHEVQALQDFITSRVLKKSKATEATFKKEFTPTSKKKRSSMTHLTVKKKKRK